MVPRLNSSWSTFTTAEVISFERCDPYPVTTTSSSSLSAAKVTAIWSWPPTATSCVAKPTKETTKTSSAPADMLKFPSKSVVVPLLVPLTTTVAPGRGPSSLTQYLILIEHTLPYYYKK